MIEVNSNALFLSTFGVKIDVKNERKKVSRMCDNAYLSIKSPKASRVLQWALDPGCRLLTSIAQLRFTTSATFGLRSWGPPLTKSWIRTCVVQYSQYTTFYFGCDSDLNGIFLNPCNHILIITDRSVKEVFLVQLFSC